jgi:epoxyqueuosine reductase QueG
MANGADLIGILKVSDLPEHTEGIFKILPSARSVLVVASRHSLAAISSANIQIAQYDTIYTYNETARAAQKTARFLESEGFLSAAVPAFIPIDMRDPKKGMRGEVCLRRAAVRAGLGSYGENGLLVTKKFGAAVRLSGIVTEADLEANSPLDEDLCDHCMRCVKSCPSGALSGKGMINKKLCGDTVFKYGLRFFQLFMRHLAEKSHKNIIELIHGYDLRELWQTFMTGNYYYCFKCQTQCKATNSLSPGVER